MINQLKHRILVFLYRRALDLCAKDNNAYELRRFYQFFDQLRALRMWKMQLLDERHLLIKYASEEVVTLRSSEPNSQTSFFVVYDFVETEVSNFTKFLLKIKNYFLFGINVTCNFTKFLYYVFLGSFKLWFHEKNLLRPGQINKITREIK